MKVTSVVSPQLVDKARFFKGPLKSKIKQKTLLLSSSVNVVGPTLIKFMQCSYWARNQDQEFWFHDQRYQDAERRSARLTCRVLASLTSHSLLRIHRNWSIIWK